jgi:hypothetical protein
VSDFLTFLGTTGVDEEPADAHRSRATRDQSDAAKVVTTSGKRYPWNSASRATGRFKDGGLSLSWSWAW